MQNLDVISINIWQILISLLNLVLLFLILKKFLYKPVKNVLAKRQGELDEQYAAAALAENTARADQKKWEETVAFAKKEADNIVSDAAETAKARGNAIMTQAKAEAEEIIRQAKKEAELEKQKAKDDIKRQIVDVSGALSEKILEREIKEEDHRALIDSFIEKIGDDDE